MHIGTQASFLHFYFPAGTADDPLRMHDCQLIGSLHIMTSFELKLYFFKIKITNA